VLKHDMIDIKTLTGDFGKGTRQGWQVKCSCGWRSANTFDLIDTPQFRDLHIREMKKLDDALSAQG
jgi:hypothetical protein